MLDWENVRVYHDGVGPGHVANDIKGVAEGYLQCHYVPDLGCGARGSLLRCLHLKGRLGGTHCLGAMAMYKGWLENGLDWGRRGAFVLRILYD